MREKIRQILLTFFVATFIVGLPGMCLAAGNGIHWYTYNEGLKKMKEEHKKGYLHFYTNWCTYCKLMDAKTFSKSKVINYLNSHYIPIKVNADAKSAKALVRQYQVDRYPLNFFLNTDATVIGARPGYIPPDLFISMLKFIGTNSYKKESFTQYLKQNQ